MTTDMKTLDALPFVLRASLPTVKVTSLDSLKDPVVGELLSRFIEEHNPSMGELSEYLGDLPALEVILNSYNREGEEHPKIQATYTTDGRTYQGGIRLDDAAGFAGGNYGWFIRADKIRMRADFRSVSQDYDLLINERTAGLGVMFSGLRAKDSGSIFLRYNHQRMMEAVGRRILGPSDAAEYAHSIPLIVVAHEIGHELSEPESKTEDQLRIEQEAEKIGFELLKREGVPVEHYRLYHRTRGGILEDYALELSLH